MFLCSDVNAFHFNAERTNTSFQVFRDVIAEQLDEMFSKLSTVYNKTVYNYSQQSFNKNNNNNNNNSIQKAGKLYLDITCLWQQGDDLLFVKKAHLPDAWFTNSSIQTVVSCGMKLPEKYIFFCLRTLTLYNTCAKLTIIATNGHTLDFLR